MCVCPDTRVIRPIFFTIRQISGLLGVESASWMRWIPLPPMSPSTGVVPWIAIVSCWLASGFTLFIARRSICMMHFRLLLGMMETLVRFERISAIWYNTRPLVSSLSHFSSLISYNIEPSMSPTEFWSKAINNDTKWYEILIICYYNASLKSIISNQNATSQCYHDLQLNEENIGLPHLVECVHCLVPVLVVVLVVVYY